MFIMFYTTADVVGRYILNRPVPGTLDMTEMTMVVMVFFGIAYTQRLGGHITVNYFIIKLKGRSYHLVKSMGMLLSLLAFGVIAYYGFKGMAEALGYGDVSASILWPTWPIRLCLAIGSTFLGVRFLIQALQHLNQAIIGVERKDLV